MIILIIYIVLVIVHLGCFFAFMDSKKGDSKYWDEYGNTWELGYMLLAGIGSILWPIFLPVILLFRLVRKKSEKFFNK
jgi:hypothetical protein